MARPTHCMKPLRFMSLCTLTLCPFITLQECKAVGFRVLNQNADAVGRGNSFVATADNPSAIYYNPAGITQIEDKQLQFGSYNLYFESDHRSVTGNKTDSTDRLFAIPHFYVTYNPPEMPLAFGVGTYSPFGLGISWPNDSGFTSIITKARIQYFTLSPVIAWEVLPNLSIAIGPTINYSATQIKSTIGLTPGDEFSFDGTAWDFGFTAGLMWQPHPQWSFGFNYFSETSMDYDGDLGLKPFKDVQDSEGTLNYPSFLSFGISYRPTPKWNIEFNVEYTDWDYLEDITILDPTGPDIGIPVEYTSGFMYKIGASYKFDNKITLNIGYFYTENNVEDIHFTPQVPDTDLHTLAIGIGYEYKNWYYSVTYQHITGPWREVRGSTPSAIGESADGDYQYTFHTLSISATVKF
ncbi:MAG: outer membrane protein transport protein [Verrucomicrobiota bacterium]